MLWNFTGGYLLLLLLQLFFSLGTNFTSFQETLLICIVCQQTVCFPRHGKANNSTSLFLVFCLADYSESSHAVHLLCLRGRPGKYPWSYSLLFLSELLRRDPASKACLLEPCKEIYLWYQLPRLPFHKLFLSFFFRVDTWQWPTIKFHFISQKLSKVSEAVAFSRGSDIAPSFPKWPLCVPDAASPAVFLFFSWLFPGALHFGILSSFKGCKFTYSDLFTNIWNWYFSLHI